MKKTKLVSFIAAAALTLGSLSACSASADGGNSGSGETAKKSVTIGTLDLVNGDLIAQYEGWYTSELGVDVKLVTFDSGKDINSALASGSIDIGQVGTSPVALAISNDLDIEVIWIGDIIGAAETLAARDGSGIGSLQDLVGKKVATPFASTAHYSLLNALKLEGIDENSVSIIDMQTDKINAAWQTGDIDAAYVWYPVLGELLKSGTPITDSYQLAQKGIVTADTNVVRREYAEANPEVVTKFVELQLRARP